MSMRTDVRINEESDKSMMKIVIGPFMKKEEYQRIKEEIRIARQKQKKELDKIKKPKPFSILGKIERSNDDLLRVHGSTYSGIHFILKGMAGAVELAYVMTCQHGNPMVTQSTLARPEREPFACSLGYHCKSPAIIDQLESEGRCSILGCDCFFSIEEGVNPVELFKMAMSHDLGLKDKTGEFWSVMEAFYMNRFRPNEVGASYGDEGMREIRL